MPFKAVLFDMDGTLLDTLTDIGNATNRILASRNFPQHELGKYRYFVGEGALRLIKCALPENAQDESTIRECHQAFLDDYAANWNHNTLLYDGIDAMLNALTEYGLKMALLSNKPHENTKACVTEHLSNWKFVEVFGQRDGIPRKPDPAGALEIAERMNLLPAEFLYLGDTGIDMTTAISAGMFPIGVLWGFRPKKELLDFGAKSVIEKPLDVLDFL